MNKQFLNKNQRQAIFNFTLSYRQKRNKALKENGDNYQQKQQELGKLRKRIFDNLPKIEEKAIKALRANGVEVHLAKDAVQARVIFKKIVGAKKRLAQAKSSAFSEIKTKELLKGKSLLKTDLGDFLADLIGQNKTHPVLPVVEFSTKDIANVIKKKFNQIVEAKPEAISRFVAGKIRQEIIKAEVGITGANAITASGEIVLLENEGNISLVSRLPEIHIVIAGREKLVESLSDANKLIEAMCLWGTGQKQPVYTSIITGPSKTADVENKLVIGAQGPSQVHLILLDNGRSKLVENSFGQLLYCLNCGACLNFCPVFGHLGGNYGDTYLGSKGIIFSAFAKSLSQAKKSGCFSCTLCEACQNNCPVGIKLPDLMKKLRQFLEKEGLGTVENKKMLENLKKYGNPFGKINKGKLPDKLFCC